MTSPPPLLSLLDDRDQQRLHPRGRQAVAAQPRIGRLSGASHSRDNLRSRHGGNGILEAHGWMIPEKESSAMRKLVLAFRPQCGHIARMTANDTRPSKEQTSRILQSIEECDRYIAIESPRSEELRPQEIKDLLAFYISHRAKLQMMIGQ
jgi:hypothetical protein